MDNRNIHIIQEDGIAQADKILINICAAMLPSIFALFAIQASVPVGTRIALSISVCFIAPSLFTLLWHSIRWPMRAKVRHEAVQAACEALSKDMLHVVEAVAHPEAIKRIEGSQREKVFQGEDGKEYLRSTKEEVQKTALDAFVSTLHPDNPIVSNIISSHAHKISDAQTKAVSSPLTESFSSFKHRVDVFARYTRYYWFSFMLASSFIGVLILLLK